MCDFKVDKITYSKSHSITTYGNSKNNPLLKSLRQKPTQTLTKKLLKEATIHLAKIVLY